MRNGWRSDEAFDEAFTEVFHAVSGPERWVTLRLLDGSGRGAAGARYRLVASDGRVFSGRLDRNGEARVEGLSPGPCRVELPPAGLARARPAWRASAPVELVPAAPAVGV